MSEIVSQIPLGQIYCDLKNLALMAYVEVKDFKKKKDEKKVLEAVTSALQFLLKPNLLKKSSIDLGKRYSRVHLMFLDGLSNVEMAALKSHFDGDMAKLRPIVLASLKASRFQNKMMEEFVAGRSNREVMAGVRIVEFKLLESAMAEVRVRNVSLQQTVAEFWKRSFRLAEKLSDVLNILDMTWDTLQRYLKKHETLSLCAEVAPWDKALTRKWETICQPTAKVRDILHWAKRGSALELHPWEASSTQVATGDSIQEYPSGDVPALVACAVKTAVNMKLLADLHEGRGFKVQSVRVLDLGNEDMDASLNWLQGLATHKLAIEQTVYFQNAKHNIIRSAMDWCNQEHELMECNLKELQQQVQNKRFEFQTLASYIGDRMYQEEEVKEDFSDFGRGEKMTLWEACQTVWEAVSSTSNQANREQCGFPSLQEIFLEQALGVPHFGKECSVEKHLSGLKKDLVFAEGSQTKAYANALTRTLFVYPEQKAWETMVQSELGKQAPLHAGGQEQLVRRAATLLYCLCRDERAKAKGKVRPGVRYGVYEFLIEKARKLELYSPSTYNGLWERIRASRVRAGQSMTKNPATASLDSPMLLSALKNLVDEQLENVEYSTRVQLSGSIVREMMHDLLVHGKERNNSGQKDEEDKLSYIKTVYGSSVKLPNDLIVIDDFTPLAGAQIFPAYEAGFWWVVPAEERETRMLLQLQEETKEIGSDTLKKFEGINAGTRSLQPHKCQMYVWRLKQKKVPKLDRSQVWDDPLYHITLQLDVGGRGETLEKSLLKRLEFRCKIDDARVADDREE